MFSKTVTAVAFTGMVAALAAPAFANPGTDQLARQLGVAPGAYSLTQLIELQDAYRDNDSIRVDFILAQGNGVASRADTSLAGAPTIGEAQLALSLGVTPGVYSTDDLVKLGAAIQAEDAQTIAFILSGSDNGGASSDMGVVTPGKAQMAALLRVDPAAYTTLQLAQMVGDL